MGGVIKVWWFLHTHKQVNEYLVNAKLGLTLTRGGPEMERLKKKREKKGTRRLVVRDIGALSRKSELKTGNGTAETKKGGGDASVRKVGP